MIREFGLENAFEGEYKLPESTSVKHTNAKTGLIVFSSSISIKENMMSDIK